MAGAGSPGDHPYTDIIGHNRNLFGGGVDEEIRALLHRFPASKREVIGVLESAEVCALARAIENAQRIVGEQLTDIWNSHMSVALQNRADENKG